jgi:hypothetical protein
MPAGWARPKGRPAQPDTAQPGRARGNLLDRAGSAWDATDTGCGEVSAATLALPQPHPPGPPRPLAGYARRSIAPRP